MPSFTLAFTREAKEQLAHLKATDPKKHKKVEKTLGLLETNHQHPSLHMHDYDSLEGPNREKVREAYVENRTPSAYRVFFYFPKNQRGNIVIVSVTPHH